MPLPPNFLDELRARTPLAAVVGRTVKLTRSGKDQKGCCPFHDEKTPSFYVYDDGFHCFGCGAHGDVFTFLMKTTGAGFMEVVENLANQAGLEVPKPSPQAVEAEQKRAGITETLAAARDLYAKWLYAPQGAEALAYLRRRGLTDATIQKFGLGFSGEGRGALAAGLRGANIKPDQLIEAGLMKQGDSGPVDMFFSRVMFPIADRRGGLISFGGRILGDGQPKYVNGPETPAFSKRRALYGLNFARDAVRKGAPLIVVEGYMDVIALAQAGFPGAVAPLGTALTAEHLDEIWRLTPEPVICFDADGAGRRAALKTVDLALSALAPDRSLKFLRLPEKEDPDSFVRTKGAAAFSAALAGAAPISAALYDMLAEGIVRTTPESRAAFRHRLTDVASRIPDKALAGEYRAMLLDRFFAERRAPGGKAKAKPFARSATASDPVATRARLMLATLLAHPELIPDLEEAFSHVPLPPPLAEIRESLNRFAATTKNLDRESLFTHLTELGFADQVRLIEVVAAENFRPDPAVGLSEIAQIWWSWYILMPFSIDTLRSQRDEAQAAWIASPDDQAACDRMVRYNLLLKQAQAGEVSADT
jgi:DNA primase